ncbi:hypothetical protein FACS1894110_14490 [Spirochaetia bacterium]|nr:hypothetical protein FACS1894110_14490 [Spirochaetia bacterium]
MPGSREIIQQIRKITEIMVGLSLCDHQNFPSLQHEPSGNQKIGIGAHLHSGSTLKNVSYDILYTELCKTQTYNIKMLDGALIQMLYHFRNDDLISHRLAFFPSPVLTEFQNNPEIYIMEEVYAEVIAKNVVPFPLRFDFDIKNSIDVQHPKSHLTLGQYMNCRIPVTAPLMPYHFIDFILRNFYNTAFIRYSDKIPQVEANLFTVTITNNEKELIYFNIPR